jgi:hypothetical protein
MSARRHNEAGCLYPRSAVRSRPRGMMGRERAARTRTSTALRRGGLRSCPERRAVIIRSARRDVCARVMPPAPFPDGLGTRTGGKDARGERYPRAPCVAGLRSDSDAPLTCGHKREPRLSFSANHLFFPAKRPRQAARRCIGGTDIRRTIPRKPAQTLASPQTTGEIPSISSRFRSLKVPSRHHYHPPLGSGREVKLPLVASSRPSAERFSRATECFTRARRKHANCASVYARQPFSGVTQVTQVTHFPI